MAEGKSRAIWQHTSAVLALLANVHRDPKRVRPFAVSDFNPHADARSQPRISVEQLTHEVLAFAQGKTKRDAPG